MFPNRHSIYMHDTPHKEYFARDVRAYSNGCIRLERPTELAEILLAGQVPDPAASFEGWVAAKAEKHVSLERSVPVHIVYRTVFFDEDGTARYRPDVYGRDAQIFEALEAKGVSLPAAQG
jgi:murein L,D-transpeptidase YcbB/YkuD